MKTILKPTPLKIIVTVLLFLLSSYLWRIYIISSISDTFPWGFPLQFYLGWGPCPPGEICNESNLLYLIIDVMFWYLVSGFLVSRLSKVNA